MYHEYRDTNAHSESKVFGVFCYIEYEAQSLTRSFFYSKPFGKTSPIFFRFVFQAEEGQHIPFPKQAKAKQTSKLLARIILVLSKLTTQAQQ